VLRAGRRPRFLAKHDLFRIPVLGWVLRSVKQIPVRRGVGDRSPLEAAEAAIRAGEVVVVYPEGTVTKRPDSLPMDGKTGAVRLSLATGVPITPMASWGSQAVWQKSGPGSLRPGRPIWISVGEPVDFSSWRDDAGDYEAVKSMSGGLMNRITDLVVDLRDRYPARWSAGTSR
jgi:1-acyl-sn-glycerol-3-phosphate acyltransferase